MTATTEGLDVLRRLQDGEPLADLAQALGLDLVEEDDCEESFDGKAVLLAGWFADDGNCEVASPDAKSGKEAAQEYVDEGDWGESTETWWHNVAAYRKGYALSDDGEVEEIVAYHDTHTVEAEPDEPSCEGGEEHDWSDGGDEFGGVRGNKGGVTITHDCTRCGLRRVEDTWAQCKSTGREGLHGIAYSRDGEQG
jgi:hypothetical protein